MEAYKIAATLMLITCIIAMWFVIKTVITATKKEHLEVFGTFIINHSDPTKDLCQLALEHDLDEIEKHRVMLIEIVVNGDIATEEPGDAPKTK